MITVIILHYYQNRLRYLDRVIEALRIGELTPNRIVIWNNNPGYRLGEIYKKGDEIGQKIDSKDIEIITIDSSKNLGCGVRHVIANAFPSDYYLFQDDDLLVLPETLKTMVSNLPADIIAPESWGGHNNIALGRLHLTTPGALIKAEMFRARNNITLPFRTDDILLSVANKDGVIKIDKNIQFENLSEEGFGLSHEFGHSRERDNFYKTIIEL